MDSYTNSYTNDPGNPMTDPTYDPYGQNVVDLTNQGFEIYNQYTNQNVNGDRFQQAFQTQTHPIPMINKKSQAWSNLNTFVPPNNTIVDSRTLPGNGLFNYIFSDQSSQYYQDLKNPDVYRSTFNTNTPPAFVNNTFTGIYANEHDYGDVNYTNIDTQMNQWDQYNQQWKDM